MEPKSLIITLFFILSTLPTSAIGKQKSYGDIEGAIYLGNYDGDTI
ncbi:MAG: hypothetical protein HQL71_14130 [Magnetococcales bacterium]|nr:hypothetical protein [Magnetococcales bacterium]